MSAIKFDHISKIYSQRSSFLNPRKKNASFQALSDISFEVAEGEFFGLLGHNGAGKTTLISILGGLTKPTQGQAYANQYNVQTQFKQAHQSIGIVPQELVYDPFFTVREMLRLQSGYFGLYHNDDWIDEILVKLGLDDKANTNMRALSGGMKRRVLVAQALVHKPPVIVLDEPTAGVDVDLRYSLWQFMRELNEQGHTILLTTHYLEEAQEMCHRLAFICEGQLVALNTTQALLEEYQTQKLDVVFSQAMCQHRGEQNGLD